MPTDKKVKTDDKEFMSLYVDPELKRAFRILCAEEGVSMNAKLIELMRKAVK